MNKPLLIEEFDENGEHLYWELRNADTNELLWREMRFGVSRFEDIAKEFSNRNSRLIILGTGGDALEDAIRGSVFPRFDKLKNDFPTFANTCIPKDVSELLDRQTEMMAEIFNSTPVIPRKLFEEPILDSSIEELYPKKSKKVYQEPPWKFNKPHNYKAKPYGKSNSSCRTARKRKNKRN